VKPKLLIVELWGLGDLVIATPFLRAASAMYEVTLLAKPYAHDLQARLWNEVKVVPFVAPWTAFKHKYRLFAWPWGEVLHLVRELSRQRFEYGLSARWDPRDHLLLRVIGAEKRLGFPRLRSEICLTQPLGRPEPGAHRYEHWRLMARALGFELPPRERLSLPHIRPQGEVLVHTGAGQAVRVWPLDRYLALVTNLRQEGYQVRVACDPEQRNWWLGVGETSVATPRRVNELLELLDRAGAFIGNDSGPGHLAGFVGVPTFTFFGPQVPDWFAPLHPASEWIEGKACPYKPCSDYCRFETPRCLWNVFPEEVWPRIRHFIRSHISMPGVPSIRV